MMAINSSAASVCIQATLDRRSVLIVVNFIKAYSTTSSTHTHGHVLKPARHVSILGRHELASPPTLAFGKIVPSGLKM